jgi:transposase-like protein
MGVCPKCQGERLVKNGSAAGKPTKRCKQCGYPFTRTTPRGKPLVMQINTVLWYLSGMSMPRIAFLLRVSAQAVLTWIRNLAKDYDEKPEPQGERSSCNLMRCGIISGKSGVRSGSGKRWITTRGSCSTGHAGAGTRRRCSRWSIAWRNGTSKCPARTSGPRMLPSSRQTSWYRVKGPHTLSNAIIVGSVTGLAASSASRSLSPSRKRWSISRWPCSQGSGLMEIKTNFYHYLIDTLLSASFLLMTSSRTSTAVRRWQSARRVCRDARRHMQGHER